MTTPAKHDDLVFDIGFHTGEDTAFYLAKGYRVVAFEANADLIAKGKLRFGDAIAAGRLTIIEGAICGKTGGPAEVTFYLNAENSEWGTVSPDFSARNAQSYNAKSREMRVPLIPIQEVIARHGLPVYAKIDVEGVDLEVLSAFADFDAPPDYVSIEAEAADFDALIKEMETLRDLGYRAFQVVQQRTIPGSIISTQKTSGAQLNYRFPRSSSGAFGTDLEGDWLSYDATVERHRALFESYRRWGPNSALNKLVGRKPIAALQLLVRRPLPGWYDTHARLAPPS
ncbi:MAG: FkbM family methyltransferase [Pseudomonadota bacterium]